MPKNQRQRDDTGTAVGQTGQIKKAQGGAGLTEAVAQLAQSAEKLVQAVERLAKATARFLVTAETQHEILDTAGPSTSDSASPREFETQAEATDGEE